MSAIEIQFEDDSTVSDFRYYTHNIYEGKGKLKGLPAVYVEDNREADTLEIVLKDTLKDIKVVLMYSVFEEYDAITRSVKVINESNEEIKIFRVLSANIDFNECDFDILQLSGGWGKERQIIRRSITRGTQSIESRRGSSSHGQNPFLVLMIKQEFK